MTNTKSYCREQGDACSILSGTTRYSGEEIQNSTIRGPCIIGRNCLIENSYIGPYTSIGDNAKVIRSSIEYSIVLKGATIEGIDRLEESLIGENAKLIKVSKRNAIKLHIGDYSEVIL